MSHIQCQVFSRWLPADPLEADIKAAISALQVQANAWLMTVPAEHSHWMHFSFETTTKNLLLVLTVDYVVDEATS